MRRFRHVRTFRTLLVVVAASATVAAVASAPGASAASTTTYLSTKKVCPAPAANAASCLAMRLIRSTKQTPGAVPASSVAHLRTARGRYYTVGPMGGYTPATVARAYGVNVNTPTTQTVAIVDAYQDPTIRADLNAFDSHYKIAKETTTSFRVVGQTGAVPVTGAHPSPPLDTTGWTEEQALDVDTVRGICRKCKILLVEANSENDPDLEVAENYAAAHASIVSNSFGEDEKDDEPTARFMAAFNHPGKAILASTGDDGWYDFDNINNEGTTHVNASNSPASPASLSTVIAVGGTALYLNADGTRASEDVWNENGPGDQWGYNLQSQIGASGGGCSTRIAAPRWQRKVTGYSSLGCGTKRSTGDIAALADPFTGYDIYTTYQYASGATDGWETLGGTSLASPLVAAMFGLAGGPHGIQYPALTLYGHFKSAKATYDVTVGANGACATSTPKSCAVGFGQNPNTFMGTPTQLVDCAFGTGSSSAVLADHYQCYANKGYDGPSGVGTPAGLTGFAPLKPLSKISNPGTVTHNVRKEFWSVHSDPFPGGKIVKYSWRFGDGTSSTSRKPTHKYTHGGRTYKITLTVTDTYGVTTTTSRKVKIK